MLAETNLNAAQSCAAKPGEPGQAARTDAPEESAHNPRPSRPKPSQTEKSLRKCAVSGDSLPKSHLIRFVADPEGLLVPDIKATLPGRGVWVSAKRTLLEEAVRRNVFARSLKTNVILPSDLIETVEALVAARAINLIGLARRAGVTVAGFEKCRAYLDGLKSSDTSPPIVAIAASDIAPGSAAKFFGFLDRLSPAIPVHRVDLLTAEELGRPFDRERLAQLVIQPGGLVAGLIDETNRLAALRDGGTATTQSLDGGNE